MCLVEKRTEREKKKKFTTIIFNAKFLNKKKGDKEDVWSIFPSSKWMNAVHILHSKDKDKMEWILCLLCLSSMSYYTADCRHHTKLYTYYFKLCVYCTCHAMPFHEYSSDIKRK